MLTQTHAAPHRLGWPTRWGLASGIAGLVANLLLVLFFLLDAPFGAAGPLVGQGGPGVDWLGPANDWMVAVQFLTLIPVAHALRRRLPATKPVRVATAAAVVAMTVVAVLQVLLVLGVVDFDLQVRLVVVAFLPVYGWLLTVSSTGHRHGTLPRPVTRFGLLLGISYPVGLLLVGVGLIFTAGSPAQPALLVTGVVVGALGWLGLPVWPLVLARSVLGRPPAPNATPNVTAENVAAERGML